jgi:hypothetical protein
MASHPERKANPLEDAGACRRLGLRQTQAHEIIRESNDEIRAVAGALFS